MEQRKDCPTYTFYDGPPTANGKPHIGHVLTRVIKDMIPRYRAMKGYYVPRKAGWDTHGLPVEIEVEKQLGLDGKDQIEAYGLEPFIAKCKESVWKYKSMWEDFSARVGFWADMEHPYVTYHNEYIESEWWALRQIWDHGLLYKGFKIVPYCPRCGTPLSAQEVAQGYKTVKEKSAVVKFRLAGHTDDYILAWTTTPWTLPSNVALCVHPDETYVQIRVGEETFILAQALVPSLFGETPYTVCRTFAGRELEHTEYEPLYPAHVKEKAHYVVCDTYVTLTDGTGVVHIAPAFGEDDARVGKAYGLPFVQYVDPKGCMTKETKWPGVFVKKADPMVLADLKERGLLFAAPNYEHEYPHCWRCDTPLLYYARDSWYIRMTDQRDRLVANNNTVNWIPEGIGKGRFGAWLENVQDWSISRNRYWGTPLNIWECSCGHRHSVGSIEELRRMSDNCPENIELHRPYIDAVTIKCPACGGVMHRVPEVIDCWFDSGAMPFAQHHYPFENKDLFAQQFPADFISEAVDQTRGWFYSLMAISTLLFNCSPYRNVIVLGHVQDEFGQKMSKSKGNAVEPFQALTSYGADAIRWYFCSNSAPWLPNRFYEKAVVEGQRKFISTLWNTYAFFVLYANIDGFDPAVHKAEDGSLSVMDRWLLSRLNTLIGEVDSNLDAYRIPETCRALERFVDDLSNWYVRRCRERYWCTGMPQDKINAYATLYQTLVTLSKLIAPMLPFMAEDIYRNLVCRNDPTAPESVHLCDFPTVEADRIDTGLEEHMAEVLDVVALGRAVRNTANIKTRQPLAAMYVKADFDLPALYTDILKQELNVKKVQFVSDASAFITYTFKPQLKTVGPKYGKHLAGIRQALSALTGADSVKAMNTLTETGSIPLSVDGSEIRLSEEDLLISSAQAPGYSSLTDHDLTVALDTNLTEELIEEGFVRELVSKIQTMRKESGFEVTDHIDLAVSGNATIEALMQRNASLICDEVLADSLTVAAWDNARQWNINGEDVSLAVRKHTAD